MERLIIILREKVGRVFDAIQMIISSCNARGQKGMKLGGKLCWRTSTFLIWKEIVAWWNVHVHGTACYMNVFKGASRVLVKAVGRLSGRKKVEMNENNVPVLVQTAPMLMDPQNYFTVVFPSLLSHQKRFISPLMM
ncbi:hypothetical protein PsorP6_006648 [Peronosclerospora sorghi]|uniref:Uncharacterized protein n=1 Tax=Peronosclerospora sorghi TaxID=230839 RepID=A0ACC0W270_9STRA|nr:hypothetical protein PsorP6_006648 [Peronosclerospora sorghi]